MTLQILGYTLATICVIAGLVGTVLPVIPGLPLMFVGMLLAAWTGDFTQIGGWTLTILGLLTLLALALDFLATALGAKRVGASRRALIGASIGTMAGLFFGLWGLFLGPFAGAAIGELQHQKWLEQQKQEQALLAPNTQAGEAQRRLEQAARVGVGTWMGLLFGAVLKLGLACTMLAVFGLAWFL